MSLYIVNRFFKQESKKIKRTEMQVLRFLVLKGEDAENGLIKNIYPSMETVASYCGISDKSARRAIKNIIDEQLIFSDGWSRYGTKKYITTHQVLEKFLTQIDDKDSQLVTMANSTSVTMTEAAKSMPANTDYRSDISTPTSVTLSHTSDISAPQMSDNHLDHYLSLQNKLNIDPKAETNHEPEDIYLFSCKDNISEEEHACVIEDHQSEHTFVSYEADKNESATPCRTINLNTDNLINKKEIFISKVKEACRESETVHPSDGHVVVFSQELIADVERFVSNPPEWISSDLHAQNYILKQIKTGQYITPGSPDRERLHSNIAMIVRLAKIDNEWKRPYQLSKEHSYAASALRQANLQFYMV